MTNHPLKPVYQYCLISFFIQLHILKDSRNWYNTMKLQMYSPQSYFHHIPLLILFVWRSKNSTGCQHCYVNTGLALKASRIIFFPNPTLIARGWLTCCPWFQSNILSSSPLLSFTSFRNLMNKTITFFFKVKAPFGVLKLITQIYHPIVNVDITWSGFRQIMKIVFV